MAPGRGHGHAHGRLPVAPLSPAVAGGWDAVPPRAVPALPTAGIVPAAGTGSHRVATHARPRTAPLRQRTPVARLPAAVAAALEAGGGRLQSGRASSVAADAAGRHSALAARPHSADATALIDRAAAVSDRWSKPAKSPPPVVVGPYGARQNRTVFSNVSLADGSAVEMPGSPHALSPRASSPRAGSPRAGSPRGSPRTGPAPQPRLPSPPRPPSPRAAASAVTSESAAKPALLTPQRALVRVRDSSSDGGSQVAQPVLHKQSFIEWQARCVTEYVEKQVCDAADQFLQKQARWDALRDRQQAAERRATASLVVQKERRLLRRQQRARQKVALRGQREAVEAAERQYRRAVSAAHRRWMREAVYLRWRDGVDIYYTKQLKGVLSWEGRERSEHMCRELQEREHTRRFRFLDRLAFVRLAQLGMVEKEARAALQHWVDEVRRFRAEQESQTNRLHASEMQEREKIQGDETWEWMEAEREHDDWRREQEERRRKEEEERRRWLRELAEEQAHRRSETLTAESTARSELRVGEASDRVDLSELAHRHYLDAQVRENARIEAETAELRARQAEEREPLQRDEHERRVRRERRSCLLLDRLFDIFATGRAEILKPVSLNLPNTIDHIAGSDPLSVSPGGSVTFKARYNPYLASSVVSATLDVGITDGWTQGDGVGVFRCPTSDSAIRKGFGLFRFHGCFRTIQRVARATGRTAFEDPFNVPPAGRPLGHADWDGECPDFPAPDSDSSDGEEGDGGSADGARKPARRAPRPEDPNRWLRFMLCVSRHRNIWTDVNWVLRNLVVTFQRHEWHPEQDIGPPRCVGVRLSVAFTPNPSDRAAGVKIVTFASHRTIVVTPLPPLLYLPCSRRHLCYDLTMERRDGSRNAMRIMQAVQVLHPDRDISGGQVTLKLTTCEEPTPNGDRVVLRGHGFDMRGLSKGKALVLHDGVEVADVREGHLSAYGEPVHKIVLRFRGNVQHWRAVELIRALRFCTQQQHPPRQRRLASVTLSEREFDGALPRSTTVDAWINILCPADVGPTFMVLSQPHHCVVWRSSGDASEGRRKYIEPALAPLCPDAIVENQHSMGVPRVGREMYSKGQLMLKVEQGCQAGDSIVVRNSPPGAVRSGRVSQVLVYPQKQLVVIRGRDFATWTRETGGLHSSGTYEGSTSAAWLKLEIIVDSYSEMELRSLLRCICFTNDTPNAHTGVRWINVKLSVHDPLMPQAGPASCTVGVRCCLPIATLPARYHSQKYVENDGYKRLGMFDLPEPVFKDDDLVAVFDGGSIHMEFLEGGEKGDALGVTDAQGREYDLHAMRQELVYRVTSHGSTRQIAVFVPHVRGAKGFTIKLGNRAERRKALDTTQRRPHAAGVKKRELQALLRGLYYCNDDDAPTKLLKLIRVTVEDSFGARSQCVTELVIQPINDQTEVILPATALRYRQGSRPEFHGFQLAKDVVLRDPDTAEVRGGFVAFELVAGGDRYERLGLLSPEQQEARHHQRSLPAARRVLLTLGPPEDGALPRVYLGGLAVGTFEFKGCKRANTNGQILKINIGLDEPWPGWPCLPCHAPDSDKSDEDGSTNTRAATDTADGDGSGRRDSARTSHSRGPMKLALMNASRGVWPTMTSPVAAAKPKPPEHSERRSTRSGAAALRAIHAAERVRRKVSSLLPLGKVSKLVQSRQPSTTDSTSQTPVREEVKELPPPIEKPKYGLPLDAVEYVMQCVVYCNTAPPTNVKPGVRTYMVKVNAGDDVADTKVKMTVDMQAPLLRILTDPTVRYVEGSGCMPVCARFMVGLPQKAPVQRGWVRVTMLDGFEIGEDELTVHDPMREVFLVPDCTPPPQAPASRKRRPKSPDVAFAADAGVDKSWFGRRKTASPSWFAQPPPLSPTSPASRAPTVADEEAWSALVVDAKLEKRLGGEALANPTWGGHYAGRVRVADGALEVHFDSACCCTAKHLGPIIRSLCYRNNSKTPGTHSRCVQIEMLWADAAVPEPQDMPGIEDPAYEYCKVDVVVHVEDIDNPTEIELKQEEAFTMAGFSGIVQSPTNVFAGVEVSDPDTPFFDPPAELTVEVHGGAKTDALDLSPHPPEGVIDNIQLHGADLCLHDTHVATVVRTAGQSSRLQLNLEHCPVDALAPILRRVVYRHMGQPKRVLKKQVQLSIRCGGTDGRAAPPARAKVVVHVLQPLLEYAAAATKIAQLGSKPISLLPNSVRAVGAVGGAELVFELIKRPLGPPAAVSQQLWQREDVEVARKFWYPWEELSWDKYLRSPDPRDALVFVTDELPADLSKKEVEPGVIEISTRDGKMCTVTSRPRRVANAVGEFRAKHLVSLHFTAAKLQTVAMRHIPTLLHAVTYQQVSAQDVAVVPDSLSPRELVPQDSGLSTSVSSPTQAKRRQRPVQRKRADDASESSPAPEGSPEVLVRLTVTTPGPREPMVTLDHLRVRTKVLDMSVWTPPA